MAGKSGYVGISAYAGWGIPITRVADGVYLPTQMGGVILSEDNNDKLEREGKVEVMMDDGRIAVVTLQKGVRKLDVKEGAQK